MNEIILQENKHMNWDPQAPYERISKTINEWPNWEKDAYNKMFAVSAHAKRLNIE